ncbi:hypothetical protein Q1695_003017 [Nippostrongylus brasiliensis]|nr:hypothetical protein Q1695_003017 [Nippostrongylus brasiliensis]
MREEGSVHQIGLKPNPASHTSFDESYRSRRAGVVVVAPSMQENGGGASNAIGGAFEFELERQPYDRPSWPSPSGPAASALPSEP